MGRDNAMHDYIIRIEKWLEAESKTSKGALLLKKYLRLLAKRFFIFIQKKHLSEQKKEDMFSHSIIKLLETLERFDEDRGVKMSTFAAKSIDGVFINFLRDESKQEGTSRGRSKPRLSNISLDQPLPANNDDFDIITLKEALVLPGSSIDNLETKMVLKQCLSVLNENELDLIKWYFFERKSKTWIGKEIGFSTTHISNLLEKALNKMREKIFPQVPSQEASIPSPDDKK